MYRSKSGFEADTWILGPLWMGLMTAILGFENLGSYLKLSYSFAADYLCTRVWNELADCEDPIFFFCLAFGVALDLWLSKVSTYGFDIVSFFTFLDLLNVFLYSNEF